MGVQYEGININEVLSIKTIDTNKNETLVLLTLILTNWNISNQDN